MLGPPQTGPSSAEQELLTLAKASSGEMGVAAVHIESGRRIGLRSSERFPMASTYKLPIAIHLLMLVDEGKEQLERMIKIAPKDIRPGAYL
jgi:beta-lactamase class A